MTGPPPPRQSPSPAPPASPLSAPPASTPCGLPDLTDWVVEKETEIVDILAQRQAIVARIPADLLKPRLSSEHYAPAQKPEAQEDKAEVEMKSVPKPAKGYHASTEPVSTSPGAYAQC